MIVPITSAPYVIDTVWAYGRRGYPVHQRHPTRCSQPVRRPQRGTIPRRNDSPDANVMQLLRKLTCEFVCDYCCLVSSCLGKGATVPIPPANFRRFVACAAALVLCAAVATTAAPRPPAPPTAANCWPTRSPTPAAPTSSTTSAAAHPAPMLNAGGGWYEMSNGGHLMIIKSASQRLTPRLLVDSHSGYQARCERDPRARTGEGCGRPPRPTPRCRHGRRLASRRSRSTPTSSTYAVRRAGPGSRPGAVLRSAPTSTTPADRAAPTPR